MTKTAADSMAGAVRELEQTVAILEEENARLDAQIPDEWALFDKNKAARDNCAREIQKARAELFAELSDRAAYPEDRKFRRALLRDVRRGHIRKARDCQRDTFPQSRARCMRKVHNLLAYAASPIDDRGSCGYGDMLAEQRSEAQRMAKEGFAIACVLWRD